MGSRAMRWVMSAMVLALVLEGCAGAKAGARPDGVEPGGRVITREQIDAMRVRTALDVVERGARHLTIQRTRQGTPVRIYQRGVSSFVLSPDLQVVVDGSLVNEGANALANILADHVAFIQILNGREATVKFGSSGGNGVIIVRTTAG